MGAQRKYPRGLGMVMKSMAADLMWGRQRSVGAFITTTLYVTVGFMVVIAIVITRAYGSYNL